MTAPHLPSWRHQPERGSLGAMIIAARLALLFGRRLSQALLHSACLYFVAFSPEARTASKRYLERVLGRRASWRDQYKHFYCFACCILDRLFLLSGRSSNIDITFTGESAIAEATLDGRGCLLFGAHIGSFEAMLALGRDHLARRPYLLMHQANARKVQTLFRHFSPDQSVDVIDLSRPDALILAAQRIQEGHCVGVLADRHLDGRDLQALPFLGAQALFPRGPHRMAMVLRCPAVMVTGLYHGSGRYEVLFETLSPALQSRPSDPDLWVLAHMKRYTEWLEKLCHRAPLNWFNFYDFWLKDPA